MNAIGPNILGASTKPLFFQVANPHAVGIAAPAPRLGEGLRVWVRSLSVFQKEALVASARTGRVWRLASDEGPYLNGHDAAPCPLAFFTAGMIASYMNEIQALAAQRKAGLRKLRLVQDNFYTMRGSMPKRTMTGGALPVALTVEIDCDLSGAALNRLIADAVEASPANGLLRGKLASLFTLARNGAALAPDKAAALDAPPQPDPGDRFDQAEPGGAERLVWPNGVTPKKPVDGGTEAKASSLADEQDRVLNIGGICTLREDGMKEITQLQYSPHGTSFKFLSEEAPENGGRGRAPDANTLLSAGIGFCFMTQFGRFANMAKLTLDAYRIVQDTHFSLGGASGGTGAAGRADPVETHVHLTTGEPKAIAREMLDVSERTCFLHALCRTDLKPRIRVTGATDG